jgi:pimeloyl-ACP methyl ester carboxylesterase
MGFAGTRRDTAKEHHGMTVNAIDRGFVRIAEGLVHYRSLPACDDGTPLVMLHASPGSSRGLEPLLAALATLPGRPRIVAPDTLGHGDSVAAADPAPSIGTYADATVRVMDALGIDRAVLYGTHTGARIACETGVRHPDRITRVIVDGIADYPPAMRSELIERYAPVMTPDDYGAHLVQAFHFVRDQALHFPHYRRDPDHRLHTRAVPSAGDLHTATLEVLKALGTYHLAYRAAFAYPTAERLALLTQPLDLLDNMAELPALREQAGRLAQGARQSRIVSCGAAPAEKAGVVKGCAFPDPAGSGVRIG